MYFTELFISTDGVPHSVRLHLGLFKSFVCLCPINRLLGTYESIKHVSVPLLGTVSSEIFMLLLFGEFIIIAPL